jgi:hypothetical protein
MQFLTGNGIAHDKPSLSNDRIGSNQFAESSANAMTSGLPLSDSNYADNCKPDPSLNDSAMSIGSR